MVINPSASQAFNVTPTLLSSLDLAAGDIHIPIWISRDGATNASKREIEASLSYSGAVSGTIGSDTITIEINSGNDSAQYFWFTVNLDSPLTLPTGTILTLTIANNTSTSGESIRVHALRSGEQPGGNVSSLISLNATDPLNVSDIEFFTDSVDTISPGTPISTAFPSTEIWVRATVNDPFGRDDIPNATITITDPTPAATVTDCDDGANGGSQLAAEKYFEYNYTLTGDTGSWDAAVTAVEGTEGLVSDTVNAALTVGNFITPSYAVDNQDGGKTQTAEPGDTLVYTITIDNTEQRHANLHRSGHPWADGEPGEHHRLTFRSD